jgi:hypothetical protein
MSDRIQIVDSQANPAQAEASDLRGLLAQANARVTQLEANIAKARQYMTHIMTDRSTFSSEERGFVTLIEEYLRGE